MPRISLSVLLVAGAVCGAGCYLSHGRDADASSARDASRPDAATPPSDGSATADGPLPVEPEPDPGPDGRPSDDPSAADWTDPDPSDFPPDEPGVVPIGDPVRLARGEPGGDAAVDIEWDGHRWGIVYLSRSLDGLEQSTHFAHLAPLGAPDGVRTDLRLLNELSARLVWAGGRFLVAVATEAGDSIPSYTGTVGFLDEAGTRASSWTSFHPATRIVAARFVHSDRWVVAWIEHDGSDVTARELGTDASWLADPVTLTAGAHVSVLRAVGLKSRSIVFRADSEGVYAHALRVPLGDDARASYPIFGRSISWPTRLGAAPFRDSAVVVEGDAGQLRPAAFDPWTAATTLGTAVDLHVDEVGVPAVAFDNAAGLVVVCAPVVRSVGIPTSHVEIQVSLFGPRLEPLGAPLTVGDVDEPATDPVGCDIGFSPDGILVAWWGAHVPDVYVRPLAVREPP